MSLYEFPKCPHGQEQRSCHICEAAAAGDHTNAMMDESWAAHHRALKNAAPQVSSRPDSGGQSSDTDTPAVAALPVGAAPRCGDCPHPDECEVECLKLRAEPSDVQAMPGESRRQDAGYPPVPSRGTKTPRTDEVVNAVILEHLIPQSLINLARQLEREGIEARTQYTDTLLRLAEYESGTQFCAANVETNKALMDCRRALDEAVYALGEINRVLRRYAKDDDSFSATTNVDRRSADPVPCRCRDTREKELCPDKNYCVEVKAL